MKVAHFSYSVVEHGLYSHTKVVIDKDMWIEDALRHATRLSNRSGEGWVYEVIGPNGPIRRFVGRRKR